MFTSLFSSISTKRAGAGRRRKSRWVRFHKLPFSLHFINAINVVLIFIILLELKLLPILVLPFTL